MKVGGRKGGAAEKGGEAIEATRGGARGGRGGLCLVEDDLLLRLARERNGARRVAGRARRGHELLQIPADGSQHPNQCAEEGAATPSGGAVQCARGRETFQFETPQEAHWGEWGAGCGGGVHMCVPTTCSHAPT
jgi:hypothetical protein